MLGHRSRAGLRGFVLAACMASTTMALADEAYRAEIEKWRRDREASLKADDGWLTVAGLYWLHQGKNTFGTDPANDFLLPEGSAPPSVGSFTFEGGDTVVVTIRDGVTATQHGKPVTRAELRVDKREDAIRVGSLSLWLHYSGDRKAIRIRDQNSRLRKEFHGLRWFPVDEQYRVTGTFVPHEKPKPVNLPNILGDIEKFTSPGVVEFTLAGQALKLEALTSGQRLWFIFRDLTSGKETYPAARFLYADAPESGKVTLDFNKAYNPPCAYNPFTTCPLPSEQNRLRVRIEAGELDYHRTTSE